MGAIAAIGIIGAIGRKSAVEGKRVDVGGRRIGDKETMGAKVVIRAMGTIGTTWWG